ncbi:MAG: Ni/Fe-hydrogenase, b-type cytochrome subunit [Solirubrobacteraceae bacterium]|jgi:Ni/Fe-hydrogenase 1 B-type cytochrome subunit
MATAAPPTRRERGAAKRPPRRVVYVFELPVRIVHWTIVIAIAVLSFTGYYIHHPFLSGSGMPGHLGFTMGEMRFVHESVGFVFIAAVMFRIYWCFVGNQYVRWSALFPITKKQRQDMRQTLQFYFYARRDPARLNGHNPLAAMAYVILYLGFIVTILTGLGLFAWAIHTSPWTGLFGWVTTVMSEPEVRLLHFLLMFIYIAFMIHHVYSAWLYDIEERCGELSSIITGYKADVRHRENIETVTVDGANGFDDEDEEEEEGDGLDLDEDGNRRQPEAGPV